ncbi:UNVERIFIED_CONTAM: Alpha-glucosidase 2 [Sesamum calycinum]|uniref:Alpha-glucosidase 2 n=1 Tax=Sesamum calycinum TaxID=2727403 RepID=A0AAW2QW66_9LAMI
MAGYEGTETRSGKMIFEPILEEGVFRFDCSADDRHAAFPSISFENSKVRDTPLVNVHKVPTYIPSFECVLGQQIVTIEFPLNTSFYGTGEASGQLERTGKRIFTWNTDAWGYGAGTTSLYQSHPWVLAVLPNGEALGVLADTTRRCEIDLRKESNVKLISSSAYPVITFGPFASPVDVLSSFSRAVGYDYLRLVLNYLANDIKSFDVIGVFQIFKMLCDLKHMKICNLTSGGHLAFYSTVIRIIDYKVDLVNQGLLPIDSCMTGTGPIFLCHCELFLCHQSGPWAIISAGGAITLMDEFVRLQRHLGKKEQFPDPKTLADDLHQHGFKAIWMLDPGIKKEEGYFVYDSGSKRDIWIQTAEGKPFVGDVWPGPCVFPDFTQSSVRSWWAYLVKDFISNGVDGIWNDMNEPALFKVYGMLMVRSTYEGMKLSNEQKRPFVLTRAGFVGSQRYAATWTGDNLSTWEHLHMSISMVVQLGLSGQPLSGPDIGGFAGNATPKLFGRWMGVGSMFPFCRGHSEADTVDHEPWSFGEELFMVAAAKYIRLFYKLSAEDEHKSSWFEQGDLKKNPYLMRSSIVLSNALTGLLSSTCEEVCRLALRRRYRFLPHIYTLFYMAHTRGIPVATPTFFAGGSIIPVAPPYQHVGEANPTDDLLLLVALNENGKAEGMLFEDDGDGYEYTNGGYLLTTYVAEKQSSVVTVKIDAWGVHGEILQIPMPSESEVSDLVLASEKQLKTRIENAKPIPDLDNVPGHKGTKLSRTPVEVKSGDWALKVVPWFGGRIISMEHLPSGTQWLHSRVDVEGYEEYSSVEYRSAGCSESILSLGKRDLEQAGEVESLQLEGDIGGGLVLERQIYISKDNPRILQIDSGIVAHEVGAGSEDFQELLYPTESYVSFTAVDGSKHEVWPEYGERVFEGDLSPNGEWKLVDKCVGLALVNRFNISQVYKCLIHFGTGTVNLELWSEDRPVSMESPLRISHEYEVTEIP